MFPLTLQVGVVTAGSESKALATLREERDNFESLFQAKAEECAELAQTNAALKTQVYGPPLY